MNRKTDRSTIVRCCHTTKLQSCSYSFRFTFPTYAAYVILLVAFTLCDVIGVATAQSDSEDTRTIEIDPFRLSIPTGAEGFVNCSMKEDTLQDTDNVTAVTWYTENGEELRTKNLTGLGYALGEDGRSIVFRNVLEEDSQIFTCQVEVEILLAENSNETTLFYNGTFEYKVYVMPTYLVPGLIILGINVFLLLVFVACLARSMVADKKRLQKYAKTN